MSGVRVPLPPIDGGRGTLTPFADDPAGAGVKGEASGGSGNGEDEARWRGNGDGGAQKREGRVRERGGGGVFRVKAVF